MTTSGDHRPPVGLPWLLRRTNQRYRAVISERLSAAGYGDVPQSGFWALEAVARGATDAGQLGAEMGVTKQAVSKAVEFLVAGRYLERRINDQDRRKADLVLTARGRRAARVITEAVAVTDATFEAALGPSELQRLRNLLSRLAGSG